MRNILRVLLASIMIFAPINAIRTAKAFTKGASTASAFSYINVSCCTTLAGRGSYLYSAPTPADGTANFPASASGLCTTNPYPTSTGCNNMRITTVKNSVTIYASLVYVGTTQINWIVPPGYTSTELASGSLTWTFETWNGSAWVSDRTQFINIGNSGPVQHVVAYQNVLTDPTLPFNAGTNPYINLPMSAAGLYGYHNSGCGGVGCYELYKNVHDGNPNPVTINNQYTILAFYSSGDAHFTVQGGECGGGGQANCTNNWGNAIRDYGTGNQANLTVDASGNSSFVAMEQNNVRVPTNLSLGRHTFKLWVSAANEDANIANIDFVNSNVTW